MILMVNKIRPMYVRLHAFNKELVRTAMALIDYHRHNHTNACTLQEVATCLIAVASRKLGRVTQVPLLSY